MERQNYINSLFAKAKNNRLLAHGNNAIELQEGKVTPTEHKNRHDLIEAMHKDHLACIDNLGMELVDFEERFDKKEQDEVD